VGGGLIQNFFRERGVFFLGKGRVPEQFLFGRGADENPKTAAPTMDGQRRKFWFLDPVKEPFKQF